MNELQIFNSEEFGQIRTVSIDGDPWFVGKDVAVALGYTDTSDAIKRHIDIDDKLTRCFTDSGQRREMYIINESGLYSLVFSSQLDSARRFKHWVTSEVLPSIRKTGIYMAKPMSAEQMMRIQLGMVDNHEERIEKLENNMVIDYGQQQVLKENVNSVVIHWLGGKESNAYHEIAKKIFSECNRDFQRHFNVNSRNNTPKMKFDAAIAYIERWEPSTNTKIAIEDCNAQIRL